MNEATVLNASAPGLELYFTSNVAPAERGDRLNGALAWQSRSGTRSVGG